MRRPLRYAVVALMALLMVSAGAWVAFMGGKADPSSEFMTEFEELTSKKLYTYSSWGLMVFDPESNATLLDIRSGEMFVPGSTTKLFTSAAIMMALGADHRFTTPVCAASMDENGAVDGPLVLVASGDPNMGGRAMKSGGINYTDEDHSYALVQGGCILTSEDSLAGIDSLSRQMYEAGARSVQDVVIDDTLFETVEMDEFVISPIIINDNLLDIMVRPGSDGKASVTARPSTDFFTIRNEVVTSDVTDIRITASGREITVRGQIAEGSEQVNLTHTVREPAAFARALMIESLERCGVDVASPATGDNPRELIPSDYESTVKLAEITSAPLSEEIKLTLKVSHNLHAETYLSLMAASRGGSDPYEGLAVEREMLERLGIDLSAVCLSDGMGGASEDRFTPSAAVRLLTVMM